NISIQSGSFKNIGAVSGSVERTRTYMAAPGDPQEAFTPTIFEYNQRNNPDFPNVYFVGANGDIRLGKPRWELYYRGGREIDHTFHYMTLTDVETGQVYGQYGGPQLYTGYKEGQIPNSQYDA
ncbi:hypothetical protein, partial [Pseudomonas viridiflava]